MNEEVLRAVAAVAAIGIFAYPFAAPALSWVSSVIRQRGGTAGDDGTQQRVRDVKTVLELSSRFSSMGSKEGIDLCQKLIDVIMKQSSK